MWIPPPPSTPHAYAWSPGAGGVGPKRDGQRAEGEAVEAGGLSILPRKLTRVLYKGMALRPPKIGRHGLPKSTEVERVYTEKK